MKPSTRLTVSIVAIAAIAFVFGMVIAAEQAPQLTDTQRLTLQVSLQKVENAQLKLQLLVVEFQKAQADAQALVKSLQKDGYDLDLEKLIYVPRKVPSTGSGAGALREQGTGP